MRLDDLKHVTCVGCGRTDVPLRPLPGAMSPALRGCAPCIARYGAEALAKDADQIIAAAETRRPPAPGRCLHCGEPTLLGPDGLQPAWCQECHRELQALRGA